MKKIGLLILLCLLNLAAFATRYFPFSISAPTGSRTTYCLMDMNVAYTATVTMCGITSGGAAATNDITAQWYWNGMLVYTDPTVYTPSSTTSFNLTLPAGTFALTPAGSYSGAAGLQVQLTSSFSTSPGGCTAGPVVVGASTTIDVVTATAPITGLDHVCMGRTITLTDGTPDGTWSITPTSVATISSTGVVTGAGIGGAGVTYTLGGCSSSISITGDGNPAPVSPATAQVCEGASTILTDASGGGTWVDDGLGVVSVGSSTGIVTGMIAGVGTVSYILPGSGCFSTATVTVNSTPSAIVGSPYVCQSSTSALSDATIGGTWLSAANAIATVGSATGVVSGVTSGSTIITYRLSATGCYTTTPVTVNVAPAAIMGDSLMCAGGSTVTLSNTVSGGSWSTSAPTVGAVSPTGTVTSGVAGTATILYTKAGCTPATKVVTVSPLPSPIGGFMSVCVGVPAALYESVPGGTWSSSDTLIATVSSAGVISGLTMGTVNITYKMPGGCKATAIATVNALAPITGTDSLCAGSTSYLADIIGGGTWSSSNTSVLTVDTFTGVITSIIAGPSYINYTLPAGCVTSKLIKVIPQIPMISGPDNICTGSATTLADVVTGGVYSSSNSFTGAVNDTSGFFVAGYPGEVSITYTSAASGIGCAVTKVITVNPLPIPLITYSGLSAHKLTTSPYYTSYQWYDSTAGLIPGANTMTLVIDPTKSEYYYIVVTDNNGCTGSYGFNFITSVGVGNVAGNNVNIYPNPATDKVVISAGVSVKAVISDMAGRNVIEQNNATVVGIDRLAPGVYMISLFDEQGVLLAKEKLVKQ